MTRSKVYLHQWPSTQSSQPSEAECRVQRRGRRGPLFDSEPTCSQTAYTIEENGCSGMYIKLSAWEGRNYILLESKRTLNQRNSGRRKWGQRPELTGRKQSTSEPSDQTVQPGGGHLLMWNRFQLILSGYLFTLKHSIYFPHSHQQSCSVPQGSKQQ